MEIGTEVVWRGHVYVLQGVDPMNVSGRRAYLLDEADAAIVEAPLEEVVPRVEPPGFDSAA